ncbi:hypothetical protein ACFV84_36145 [Kitasatospora sp. NPDC059811]|uniref:hypothetical protein n=1 Tax=Streptomycetaceae TaxID=2062 RepID=UPI0007AEFD7E|nr:hypothetical protein [Streptomyces sp. MJM8645]
MMTRDERLRCIAYMEAVWFDNAHFKMVLTRTAPGERPLPELLAEFAEAIVQTVVTTSFGIHDGLGPEQLLAASDRMKADPGARYSAVLTEALAVWARTADGQGAEDLARIVMACLLGSDPGLAEDDLPTLLEQLRASSVGEEEGPQ